MSANRIVMVFGVLASLLACSSGGSASSTSDEGGGGAIDASSNAVCDAQAAGCPESGADYAEGCKAIGAQLPAECAADYDAYARCQLAVGFTCAAATVAGEKPSPQSKDPTKCVAEVMAWSHCATKK